MRGFADAGLCRCGALPMRGFADAGLCRCGALPMRGFAEAELCRGKPAPGVISKNLLFHNAPEV